MAVGCASRPVGPVDVLAAYTEALRDGRLVDAWRMLSAEARQSLSYADFERAAREHPDEVREAIRTMSEPDLRAPITARLDLGSGESVTLVQENGEWHLDPSALEFYGQRTPRQSLRSFVRALQRHRWDVLVRLAPRDVVARLSEPSEGADPSAPRPSPEERLRVEFSRPAAVNSVQSTIDGLRQALDRGRPIEVVGDRATMSYGPGSHFVAQLVREDGLWKIEHSE